MTALDGVKVLDLTRVHAGPFSSMVLADLGATVVKVERPKGDETRRMSLFSYGEMSAFFVASNRNKHTVVLDVGDPADRPRIEQLVRGADLVVDNFKPTTLRRLGLDYETLREINPRVVSVSVNGWGSHVPDEDSPAYDLLAQARGGVMSLNGEPGQRPLKVGVPIGDLIAGLYAATGAIAALRERELTGRGQRVEVAMLDAQVAMLHYHYSYYDASGAVLPRIGSQHQNMVPYGIYACSDGYLAVAVVPHPEKFWTAFCEVLDRRDWIASPRYGTNDARVANREALTREIEETLAADTRAGWYEKLVAAGVPSAPVNELSDLEHDPTLRAREMIVELRSPAYGRVRVPGNPIKMSGALPVDRWSAPPLLADSADIDPAAPDWRASATATAERPTAFDRGLVAAGDGPPRLRGWRCARCGDLALGLRVCCPVCGHDAGEEVALGQDATLETWSSVTTREGTYVIGYARVGDVRGEHAVRVFAPIDVDDERELVAGQPIRVAFRSAPIHGEPRLHHYFVPRERTREETS